MALLRQDEAAYYNDKREYGNYQFTSLDNIINQFLIAYVGEGKLISKARKTEVAFHAQRAVQELSFDTFKSVKSQEVTVPNFLTIPLPQDYVNYTKIAWSDSGGIEHIIYPMSKTSNPQSKGNLITNSDFDLDSADWTLGTGWSHIDYDNHGGVILGSAVANGNKLTIPVGVKNGMNYILRYTIRHADPMGVGTTISPGPTATDGRLGITLYGDGYKAVHGNDQGTQAYQSGVGGQMSELNLHTNNIMFSADTTLTNTLEFNPDPNNPFTGVISNVALVEIPPGQQDVISSTWSSYKSSSPQENVKEDHYKDDVYWPSIGQRYGLDPERAHVNGYFYMDDITGLIHFSSNLSGKTVVIKYISDSLGTDAESRVHKFAEEAVYKWIAYGIVSTTMGMPEYIIRRYKKEQTAATRTAKLRLSNIKIEEITRTLRGMSKQIKH